MSTVESSHSMIDIKSVDMFEEGSIDLFLDIKCK